MRRPPRPAGRPLLTRSLLARLSLGGSVTALGALALMLWQDPLSGQPGALDRARWLAFTTLVVGQVIRAYANRSVRVPVFRLARNGFLMAAVAAVIVIQLAVPLVPALTDAFRATSLGPLDWALVALIALGPALLAEAIRASGREWVA